MSQNRIERAHCCPKLEGLPGAAIDGGPAPARVRPSERRPWRGRAGGVREAQCGAARARPGTRGRVRGGLGTCHAAATCVRDRVLGEPPDGRRGSSSRLGCGPTSQALDGIPAGRTKASAKKCLLRDHAPLQLLAFAVVAAQRGRADGAPIGPGHAGIGPPRPGGVWPAAAPPASAAPDAGIRGPGSNAGSNAAAGSGGHSLCAGTAAAAVVADCHRSGRLAYHDGSPRECVLPRVSPGGTRFRSPRAFSKTGSGRSYASLSAGPEPHSEGNSLRNAAAKETIKPHRRLGRRSLLLALKQDNEGNSLRNV
jgi:hypothetical protein